VEAALERSANNAKLCCGERNQGLPCGDFDLPCMGHFTELLRCQSSRVLPPQYVIFSQGESPHTVCFIGNGLVKLTRTEADGNQVIVDLRQRGWMLGIVPFLLNTPYLVTAETITRCKVCFVPGEAIRKAMDTNMKFSRWILTLLGRGLQAGILGISEKSCFSGRHRLLRFLRKLIQAQVRSGGEGPIKVQMILKNWEVAQLLALTPQHLCRLFRQLEDEGIAIRRKGWLVFPEPDRFWCSTTAPNNSTDRRSAFRPRGLVPLELHP
jgi:CRP-like cAMP-binding protein